MIAREIVCVVLTGMPIAASRRSLMWNIIARRAHQVHDVVETAGEAKKPSSFGRNLTCWDPLLAVLGDTGRRPGRCFVAEGKDTPALETSRKHQKAFRGTRLRGVSQQEPKGHVARG